MNITINLLTNHKANQISFGNRAFASKSFRAPAAVLPEFKHLSETVKNTPASPEERDYASSLLRSANCAYRRLAFGQHMRQGRQSIRNLEACFDECMKDFTTEIKRLRDNAAIDEAVRKLLEISTRK